MKRNRRRAEKPVRIWQKKYREAVKMALKNDIGGNYEKR